MLTLSFAMQRSSQKVTVIGRNHHANTNTQECGIKSIRTSRITQEVCDLVDLDDFDSIDWRPES